MNDKLTQYDIENVTKYFEEQILASKEEDPAIYSFVSTKPLQCAGELSKKVASTLRRLPGIKADNPTYTDPLGTMGKLLPDGNYFSGLLNKTVDTKNFKLDGDTLNRLGINTNNMFESLKNTMASATGMLPGLGEVGSMMKALEGASPADLNILKSTMNKTNTETSKKAMADLVGIMPLSLFSTYFKENPTCGLDGQVAEATAKPIVDKFMAFMSDSVYTGKTNKTMPAAIQTSMATLNKLAGNMKEDLFKLMDVSKQEADNRVKEVSNLSNTYIAKNTLDAKSSIDSKGAAEKSFSIPFGSVTIGKGGANVSLDSLPKPKQAVTDLVSKIDNADVNQINNIFNSRVGQNVTKFFS